MHFTLQFGLFFLARVVGESGDAQATQGVGTRSSDFSAPRSITEAHKTSGTGQEERGQRYSHYYIQVDFQYIQIRYSRIPHRTGCE